MWKAILIDDEPHALEALNWELKENCPEIEVIAMLSDPISAIRQVYELQPDILFLDIEMPRMNGFDLLKAIPKRSCKIIFTTAYDKFAIKAIKVNAFDYLLKPIDSDELRQTIDKFIEGRKIPETTSVEHMIKELDDSIKTIEKLAITTNTGTDFINQSDILFCESSGNYTYIHTIDDKICVSKTLKFIEAQLNASLFIRVHHSYLVNINHIKKYTKGEGGEIETTNGLSVRVSRSKKEEVINRLNIKSAN